MLLEESHDISYASYEDYVLAMGLIMLVRFIFWLKVLLVCFTLSRALLWSGFHIRAST